MHPLDEYPIHQVPLSMRYTATSDRNVYDRCIMQCFSRDGETELITGLGVYPNLGVIDGYAVVRRDNHQIGFRTSDALGDDRLNQQVGPLRFEVIEPLKKIRAIAEAPEHGLAFDLTFEGTFAATEEPHHLTRAGDRVQLDACRFVQVGRWEGTLNVDGTDLAVSDPTWSGTRDRSWGIRPSGEAEPPGRQAEEGGGFAGGFWWNWVPLRFDDFSIVVIAQERSDGYRILNEAVRIWPESSGRGPEQLGWPEIEIRYTSGTRHPEHATIHLTERGGKELAVEIDTAGFLALQCGCGYGDSDWSHGEWKGRGWVEPVRYDLADPAVAGRIPYGVVDHVAVATLDGAPGTGIFEHASIGRHDPSGMADITSVAP